MSHDLRSLLSYLVRRRIILAALAFVICLPAAGFAATKFNFFGGIGADFIYYTPAASSTWSGQSSDPFPLTLTPITLGTFSSQIAPADYNGDTITDPGVFFNGNWQIRFIDLKGSGSAGGIINDTLGQAVDIPVPANYIGTREAELAVFTPAGQWFMKALGAPAGQTIGPIQWGTIGDIPVAEDYDGDCLTDLAVFRPSNGTWYIRNSSNLSITIVTWGVGTDIPVPADYDGDGRADIAVYRAGNPSVWYLLKSSQGFQQQAWGMVGDIPVPADYTADGRSDLAIYRNGQWWVPGFPLVVAGTATDIPVPQ